METISVENLLRFLEYKESVTFKKTAGHGTDDPDLNITLEKEIDGVIHKHSHIVGVIGLSSRKGNQSFKPIVKSLREDIENEHRKRAGEKENGI